MLENPPVVGVIGPSLSSEMTMVGQIGPFYDVLQVCIAPSGWSYRTLSVLGDDHGGTDRPFL